MKKRKYNKTLRAEQQDETREKIVEATVALHGSLGPAKTSIKAIAEKAGVQRLTVYRHFPDEASLFQACSSHYFSLYPPPNMGDWAGIDDPSERSRTALFAFYSFYRTTEEMLAMVYRDIDQVPAMHGPVMQFEGYIDQVRDNLVEGWTGKSKQQDKKSLALTLRHCLRFSTWLALKNEGLSDKKITELVMGWIEP